MQPLHHRGNFVVEIFETQNPANREVWGVFLNSLGRVTVFTNFPPGTYSVSVKGQRWLRRTLIDALEVTVDGARLDVPFHLTNGDIDRDNEVSISDYASLSAGFGAVAGTTRYQQYVVADLNEDGSIDIGDYSILSRNFGQVGDD